MKYGQKISGGRKISDHHPCRTYGNGRKFVIYKALSGTMKTYARPLKDFMSEIDKEKYPKAEQDYRFVKNA